MTLVYFCSLLIKSKFNVPIPNLALDWVTDPHLLGLNSSLVQKKVRNKSLTVIISWYTFNFKKEREKSQGSDVELLTLSQASGYGW